MSDQLLTSSIEKSSMHSVDSYPSRNGQPSRLIARQDPVVYAPRSEPAPIDTALVDSYEKNGFVILDDVFTPQEIRRFQDELDRLRHAASQDCFAPSEGGDSEVITESDSQAVRSIFRIHDSNALFKTVAGDSRLTCVAQYLLHDQVYIYQSRLNYKPQFKGKEFFWHSDFETWHVEDGMPRMHALSMSITLTENRNENGPLMFIPNSHRYFVTCEGETPEKHYRESLKKQTYGVPSEDCLDILSKDAGVISATSKPGSVILFDCNLLHGSNGNISPFPRSNLFFVYNALSNQVRAPFGDQPPRPEYLCTRQCINPL